MVTKKGCVPWKKSSPVVSVSRASMWDTSLVLAWTTTHLLVQSQIRSLCAGLCNIRDLAHLVAVTDTKPLCWLEGQSISSCKISSQIQSLCTGSGDGEYIHVTDTKPL